jgi:hypothetical protein
VGKRVGTSGGVLAVLGAVASVALALAASFVLGLTVVFGSGGFGGPSVDRSREATAQALLLASALGPSALVVVRDRRLWVVVGLQLVLLLVAVQIGP